MVNPITNNSFNNNYPTIPDDQVHSDKKEASSSSGEMVNALDSKPSQIDAELHVEEHVETEHVETSENTNTAPEPIVEVDPSESASRALPSDIPTPMVPSTAPDGSSAPTEKTYSRFVPGRRKATVIVIGLLAAILLGYAIKRYMGTAEKQKTNLSLKGRVNIKQNR